MRLPLPKTLLALLIMSLPIQSFANDLNSSEEETYSDLEFEDLTEKPEAQNPYIGLAASVVAETPKQNTPIFFSEAELFLPRLPGLTGERDFTLPEGFDDESESVKEPSQDISEIPHGKSGETFISEGYPERAPKSFSLIRNNNLSHAYGTVSTSARIWGKVWHSNMPGVQINAEIETKQIHDEKRGAKRILTRPKAETSALAYIPIDDGGGPVKAHVFVLASLPDRAMDITIMPYSEDPLASLGMLTQVRKIVSTTHDPRGFRELKNAMSKTLGTAPIIGGLGVQEIEFILPRSQKGLPRGILIELSGRSEPQEIKRHDTMRGLDRITEITEQAKQRGKVTVRLGIAYKIEED